MKNIARKLSALLLVFVVSAAALCPAFAATASLPSLPSGQCVVDDANVLSSSTVQTITDLNAQLESSCSGAQIGVLTVDYTGSCTTEEYALQAANAWGIGSSTGNNGVLILLVMETQQYADGDYYIATGDGFRNTTLESQASALAQTMEDDFVRQDYDDAVTTCARNVAQTIADIYGVSLSGGNTNNGSYNEPAYDDNSSGGLGDILLGFITILFTVVLLLIIVSVVVYTFSGPLGGLFWCFGGPWHRGPRPPRGRRNPPRPRRAAPMAALAVLALRRPRPAQLSAAAPYPAPQHSGRRQRRLRWWFLWRRQLRRHGRRQLPWRRRRTRPLMPTT